MNWISELHRVIGVVTQQPRLQASGFDDGLALVSLRSSVSSHSSCFDSLLQRLQAGLLEQCYRAVETVLDGVNSYVSKWFAYQVRACVFVDAVGPYDATR